MEATPNAGYSKMLAKPLPRTIADHNYLSSYAPDAEEAEHYLGGIMPLAKIAVVQAFFPVINRDLYFLFSYYNLHI